MYLPVDRTIDNINALDEAPLYLLFNSIQLIFITATSSLFLLRVINRKIGTLPEGLIFQAVWTTVALLLVILSYPSLCSINSCRMCLATLKVDALSVGGLCSHGYKVFLLGLYSNWVDLLKIRSSTLWVYNGIATIFAIYLS